MYVHVNIQILYSSSQVFLGILHLTKLKKKSQVSREKKGRRQAPEQEVFFLA